VSNYIVELVEIRKKKGKEFLHIKVCGEMVGFFEEEDISVRVKAGDIISCSIFQKGTFLNGTNLEVLDKEAAYLETEKQLGIKRELGDNESKLHAGSRIYHFEVKNSSKGDKYLVITEQSGKKKNKIFIFDDHAKEFAEKFLESLEKLNQN